MSGDLSHTGPPSPLPPGWTEHTGPQGQIYYYNSQSKQSTYTRPTEAPSAIESQSAAKLGKDKPLSKIPIPDADGWLKVTTTNGNVFYTHKPTKRSEWTIPKEIEKQVQDLESELSQKKEEKDAKRKREEGQTEGVSEKVEKANENELRPSQSKDGDNETPSSKRPKIDTEEQQESISEFKQAEPQTEADQNPEDEDDEGEDEDEEWQRQMAAEMAAEAQEQEDQEKEQEQELSAAGEKQETDTAPQNRMVPPGPPPSRPPSDQQPNPQAAVPQYSGPPPPINFSFPPPAAVNYSVPPPPLQQMQQMPPYLQPPPAAPIPTNFSHEESLALFKNMLTSLNGTREEIDPMAPWDKELPKFVGRAEYARLNSLKDRQEAFNDWCKLRLREKRAEKAKAKEQTKSADQFSGKGKEKASGRERNDKGSTVTSNGSGSHEEEAASYKQLLKENVTSTRMIWDDFRKKFRKDRRFFGFGRDDKIREKAFRDWLRELGETKRLASIQAEKEFKVLLSEKLDSPSEHGGSKEPQSRKNLSDLWKQLKQTPGLVQDERYDRVGSSSKRLELFGDWLQNADSSRATANGNPQIRSLEDVNSSSFSSKSKADQREKALREREERVRQEKSQLNRNNQSALSQIQRQDSTLHFNQFLVDEIKDPLLTFSQIARTFESDSRFNTKDLHYGQKKELVEARLNNLFARNRDTLRKIFEEVSKGSLDLGDEEREKEVLEEVREHQDWERLKLDSLFKDGKLEKELKIWKDGKYDKARREFGDMLRENAFISFWGKLRKEKEDRGEGDEDKAQDEEDEEDQPDLLKMAQKVDLEEVHSILRNDQRYRAFKHLPQKRDEWIRDHLSNQAKSNQTVHQK